MRYAIFINIGKITLPSQVILNLHIVKTSLAQSTRSFKFKISCELHCVYDFSSTLTKTYPTKSQNNQGRDPVSNKYFAFLLSPMNKILPSPYSTWFGKEKIVIFIYYTCYVTFAHIHLFTSSVM